MLVGNGHFIYLVSINNTLQCYLIDVIIIGTHNEKKFILKGIISATWAILWAIFVYNKPKKHPWISYKERALIESSLSEVANIKKVGVFYLVNKEFIYMQKVQNGSWQLVSAMDGNGSPN